MKLLPLSSILAGALLLVACASSTHEGSDEVVDADEAQLNATCKYPRRYAAILKNGEACTNVPASRGEWVAAPAFEGAPSGACTYEWSGEKRARVDRATIRGYVENREGVLSMMCGGSATDTDGLDPGYVEEIDGLSIYGMAGSVGCDVCGIERNGKVWVVIPPERETHGELQVPLSDGRFKAFRIRAPQGASVMSLTLPPPPPGTHYVSSPGPITIY